MIPILMPVVLSLDPRDPQYSESTADLRDLNRKLYCDIYGIP